MASLKSPKREKLPEFAVVRPMSITERWKIGQLKQARISPTALIDQKCRPIYGLSNVDKWKWRMRDKSTDPTIKRRGAVISKHKHGPISGNAELKASIDEVLRTQEDVEYIYWKHKEGVAESTLHRVILDPELQAFLQSLDEHERIEYQERVKSRVYHIADGLRQEVLERQNDMNASGVFHPNANAARAHTMYLTNLHRLLAMTDIQDEVLNELRVERENAGKPTEETDLMDELRKITGSPTNASGSKPSSPHLQRRLSAIESPKTADQPSTESKRSSVLSKRGAKRSTLPAAGVSPRRDPRRARRGVYLKGANHHSRTRMFALGNTKSFTPKAQRKRYDIGDPELDEAHPYPITHDGDGDARGIHRFDAFKDSPEERSRVEHLVGDDTTGVEEMRKLLSRQGNVSPEFPAFVRARDIIEKAEARIKRRANRASPLLDGSRPPSTRPGTVPDNLGPFSSPQRAVQNHKAPFHDLSPSPEAILRKNERLIGENVEDVDAFYGKLERPPTGKFENSFRPSGPSMHDYSQTTDTLASEDTSMPGDSVEDTDASSSVSLPEPTGEDAAPPMRNNKMRRQSTHIFSKRRFSSMSNSISDEDPAVALQSRLEDIFRSLRFPMMDKLTFVSRYCDALRAKQLKGVVDLWEKAAVVVASRERIVELADLYLDGQPKSVLEFPAELKEKLSDYGLWRPAPIIVSIVEHQTVQQRYERAKRKEEARVLALLDELSVGSGPEVTTGVTQGADFYAKIQEEMDREVKDATAASKEYLDAYQALLDGEARSIAKQISNAGDILLYGGRPYLAVMQVQETERKRKAEAAAKVEEAWKQEEEAKRKVEEGKKKSEEERAAAEAAAAEATAKAEAAEVLSEAPAKAKAEAETPAEAEAPPAEGATPAEDEAPPAKAAAA